MKLGRTVMAFLLQRIQINPQPTSSQRATSDLITQLYALTKSSPNSSFMARLPQTAQGESGQGTKDNKRFLTQITVFRYKEPQ